MTLGEFIEKARREKGLNQVELASRLALDQSTISRIENGQYSVGFEQMVWLARALDFDLNEAARLVGRKAKR